MNYTNKPYFKRTHCGIKPYIIGFILSVILTIIPFIVVKKTIVLSNEIILWIIISTAIIQIIVHLICFLHMNTSSNNFWNLISFLFTIIIIGIVIIGSIWIMYNLKINMMIN